MITHILVEAKGTPEILRMVELLVETGITWEGASFRESGAMEWYLKTTKDAPQDFQRRYFQVRAVEGRPRTWSGSSHPPLLRGIPTLPSTTQEFEDMVHPNGG